MNEMNPVSAHWRQLGLPLLAKAHDSFCQALLGSSQWTVLEDHPDGETETTSLHYSFADGTESVLKEAERLLKFGLKRRYPDEKLLWRVPNR